MEDLKRKTSKTEVLMLRALFEGFVVYETYNHKRHIMIDMDARERSYWPYYDIKSLCGTLKFRKQWFGSAKNLKWSMRSRYSCKTCKKYYKKFMDGDK